MALREQPLLEQLECLVGQIEQANEVRHRDAAAPDPEADLFPGQAQLLDEGHARSRLVHGIEVLPGHVLNQRDLQRGGVVMAAHERRDRLQLGEARRSPPAFAGDVLVALAPGSAGGL